MIDNINKMIENLSEDKFIEITLRDMSVHSYEQGTLIFQPEIFKVLVSVIFAQIRFTVKINDYVYADYGTNIENLEYENSELIISDLIGLKVSYMFCKKIIFREKGMLFEQELRAKSHTNPFQYETIYINLDNYISIKTINSTVDSYINYSVKRNGNEQSKACYVATLVYEDIDHPKVELLRNFRDQELSKTSFGRQIISFYYTYSQKWVTKLEGKKILNFTIRKMLDFLIYLIKK